MEMGTLLKPIVKTSIDGGLSMDDLADACVSKIISVSETAPPEIREQAKFFRENLRILIKDYLTKAASSQKDTCIQTCIKGGQDDAANLIRRM